MKISSETLKERLPVWEALSEFFLDTELDETDCRRIAECLAASPYSEEEIENILRYEVYPPCHWNLLCVTGEWEGFGKRWIMQRVAPRYNKRPRFRLPVLFTSIFRDQWARVRMMVVELRRIKDKSE